MNSEYISVVVFFLLFTRFKSLQLLFTAQIHMDIAKLFKIKLASLQRISKELQRTRESKAAEANRLGGLQNAFEYEADERASRVQWQERVVSEHEQSIFDAEDRVRAAIEDVENCLRGLKAAPDADMSVVDDAIVHSSIEHAQSMLKSA